MASIPPLRISFLLFPNVTQLDLTGPAQLLSQVGNATIDLVGKTMDPAPTDAGFALTPTATFADAVQPEILCIPGGLGVNQAMLDDATIAWVRHAAAGAQWVTSVCTGALVLGAAGLLKGYRATTHWASLDFLSDFGAIPVPGERYVFDRNRATGGGVTAGLDFGLALIAAIRGDATAELVQLGMQYDPHPPFDSGSPQTAAPRTVEAYRRMTQASQKIRAECVREAAANMPT